MCLSHLQMNFDEPAYTFTTTNTQMAATPHQILMIFPPSEQKCTLKTFLIFSQFLPTFLLLLLLHSLKKIALLFFSPTLLSSSLSCFIAVWFCFLCFSSPSFPFHQFQTVGRIQICSFSFGFTEGGHWEMLMAQFSVSH